MSQQTTNYNFNLIENSDQILQSLQDLNSNFSSIDTILNNISKSAIQELESPVRIWDLDDGIYLLPQNCIVYYKGQTDTASYTTSSQTYMIVDSFFSNNSVYYKFHLMFYGNNTGTRYLRHGYTSSTDGVTGSMSLNSVLTSISSYVKNQLDYSTSNTTYALSAYQGYVLDHKKAEKSEVDMITSNNTKTSTKSTTLNLTDSLNGLIKDTVIYGNTEQDDTPTPSDPVDVDVVTGDVTVNVSTKNLYNATTQSEVYKAVTISADKEYIYLNGTPSSNGGFSFPEIMLPKGSFRLCLELISGTVTSTASGTTGALFYFSVGGNNGSSAGINETNYQKSISRTLSENANGKIYLWLRTSDTYNNVKIRYQIINDLNNTADYNFEPYKGQSQLLSLGNIELDKIGDYQDYIYKDETSGKWYLSKNTNKFVFDGSESWTQHNSTNENFLCVYRNISDMSTGISIITNLFTRKNKVGTEDCVYNSYQQNFVVSISKSIVTTVEEFKTWLATNNLYVYFRKSIPEITEITDTTLIAQLEALYSLKTYKPVTNVYTTTQNLSPELTIDYEAEQYIKNNVINEIWKGTQTQYDNLGTYSNTTLYLIEEA